MPGRCLQRSTEDVLHTRWPCFTEDIPSFRFFVLHNFCLFICNSFVTTVSAGLNDTMVQLKYRRWIGQTGRKFKSLNSCVLRSAQIINSSSYPFGTDCSHYRAPRKFVYWWLKCLVFQPAHLLLVSYFFYKRLMYLLLNILKLLCKKVCCM